MGGIGEAASMEACSCTDDEAGGPAAFSIKEEKHQPRVETGQPVK